jgi:hypothetical protein
MKERVMKEQRQKGFGDGEGRKLRKLGENGKFGEEGHKKRE